MGTKNNPGQYDCYTNAAPDEPMFILLGRDPCAPLVVTLWVKLRREMGKTNLAKIEEARSCARAMETWGKDQGKGDDLKSAMEIFRGIVAGDVKRIEHLTVGWSKEQRENRKLRAALVNAEHLADQLAAALSLWKTRSALNAAPWPETHNALTAYNNVRSNTESK